MFLAVLCKHWWLANHHFTGTNLFFCFWLQWVLKTWSVFYFVLVKIKVSACAIKKAKEADGALHLLDMIIPHGHCPDSSKCSMCPAADTIRYNQCLSSMSSAVICICRMTWHLQGIEARHIRSQDILLWIYTLWLHSHFTVLGPIGFYFQ